jgi:hypothetical protein
MNERSEQMSLRPRRVEAQADLDHGQAVVVAARWLLIVIGLFLLILKPTSDLVELRLQIAVILLLGLVNFFLHAQLLGARPVREAVAYGASAFDLVVVTILVLSQSGDSPTFVLYFPALVALSVAFRPFVTSGFAIATAGVYGVIAVHELPARVDAAPIVLTRVLMLAAVAFCGAVYWYVEHDRRRRVERSLS